MAYMILCVFICILLKSPIMNEGHLGTHGIGSGGWEPMAAGLTSLKWVLEIGCLTDLDMCVMNM